MKTEEKELIFVSKEFADKFNKIDDKAQKEKAFNEYIESVTKASKDEYRASLDCLEEDLAIYKGLMLKTKQAFEKAKDESINAAYEMWENYDKEKVSLIKKVESVLDVLNPLQKKLENVDNLLSKINTYNFNRLLEAMSTMNSLYGKNKEMFEFLVMHYGKDTD